MRSGWISSQSKGLESAGLNLLETEDKYRGNISSKLFNNSEADALELLNNLEEIFPRDYIDSDAIGMF